MTVQISRQQILEARQLAQIAYKDEKGHKSAQKPVISITEIPGPRQGRDDHDQGQGQAVIEDMSYGEDGQEKHPAQGPEPPRRGQYRQIPCPPGRQPHGNGNRRSRQAEQGQRQQQEGHQGIGQEQQQKRGQIHGIVKIKIQVLRIAYGRTHTAQIGRQRLEDDDKRHLLLTGHFRQGHQGKRHKGQERHIVGHPHTDKKTGKDQDRRQLAHRPQSEQETRQHGRKDTAFPQAADDDHEAEQNSQYRHIDIPGIGRQRRYGQHRHRCRHYRQDKYQILFEY